MITLPMIAKMLLVAIILLSLLIELETRGLGFGLLLTLFSCAVFWCSKDGAVSLYNVSVFFIAILCIGVEEMLLPTTGVSVGERGVVRTALRPSGTALIDGRLVDVVSEGVFLPKGIVVRVIAVEGMRVVVRCAEETEKC